MAKENTVQKDLSSEAEQNPGENEETVAYKTKRLKMARQIQFQGHADEEDELAESVPSLKTLRRAKNAPKRIQRGPSRVAHSLRASRIPPRTGGRPRRQSIGEDQEDDTADEICITLPTLRETPARQKRQAIKEKTASAAKQTTIPPVTVTPTVTTQPLSAPPPPPLPRTTQMTSPITTTGAKTQPPPKPSQSDTQITIAPAIDTVNAVVAAMQQTLGGKPRVKPQPTATTGQTEATPVQPKGNTSPDRENQVRENMKNERRKILKNLAKSREAKKRKEGTQDEQPPTSPKKPKLDDQSTKTDKPKSHVKDFAKDNTDGASLPPPHTLFPVQDSEEHYTAIPADAGWKSISIDSENKTQMKVPVFSQAKELWVPSDLVSQGKSSIVVRYIPKENSDKYPPKAVKFNVQGNSPISRKLRTAPLKHMTKSLSFRERNKMDQSFWDQNKIQDIFKRTGSPHFVRGWGHVIERFTVIPMEYVRKGVLTRFKHSKKIQDVSNPSHAWRLVRCLTKALSVMAYGSEDPYHRVFGWTEIVQLDWSTDNVFVGPQNLAIEYHTCGGNDRTCYKLGDYGQAIRIQPPGKDRNKERKKELATPSICFNGSVKPPESQRTINLDQDKAEIQNRIDDPIAARYSYKTNIYLMGDMLTKLIGESNLEPEPELLDTEKERLEADLVGSYEDESQEEVREINPSTNLSLARLSRVLKACTKDDPRERPEIGWLLAQAIIGLAEAGDVAGTVDDSS